MPTYSDIREHVLDLLWSQWHELGVSSTVPQRHSDDFIDPEPLIAFTATHSDLDPRLRDESIDWVLRYGTYVSRARLKNVLADWGLAHSALFGEYAATVNANGGAGWPAGDAKPLQFRSRARSLLEDLGRPALLSLRIRAIVGVGARAELLRAFLSRSGSAMTAADLSAETSYRKRNVLNELESLRFSGIVTSFRAVNVDRFSLTKAKEVEALVAPLPRRFTRWTLAFGALNVLFDLVRRSAKRSDLQNAAEAARLLDERREQLAEAGMYAPPLPTGQAAWSVFADWVADHARSLARV